MSRGGLYDGQHVKHVSPSAPVSSSWLRHVSVVSSVFDIEHVANSLSWVQARRSVVARGRAV